MAGSIRPRLMSAAAKLKQHGDHDEAAAIEAVLGPRGYLMLRRTEAGETEPLSITTTDLLKKAVKEAEEAFDLVVDGLAEEAYRMVRDGEWVPAEVGRAARGSSGKKAVLQVSVDSELRRQVQAMLPELSKKAGYRITEANIVLTHVCEELGIERPNTALRDELHTRIPRALHEHFYARASAEEVRQIVEDGFRALLAGEWKPEKHPYLADRTSVQSGAASSWSEADRKDLRVRIDRQLLAEVRDRLDEQSERLGFLMYPGSVARAILTERLGEPAE